MALLSFVFVIAFASAGLQIEQDSISVNKTYNHDSYVLINISNTENFDFYNISFEQNPYISIQRIPLIYAGQTVTTNATITSNSRMQNQEVLLRGFYQSNIGTSNETHEIQVNYDSGLSRCGFSIIEGDTVTWRNMDSFEVKMRNVDSGEDVNVFSGDEEFSITFDEPQEFVYQFMRYGFVYTDTCKITVLSSEGIINNPEYDDSLLLNVEINYEPTTVVLNVPETSYTLGFVASQDGLFTITNIGDKVAKEITLSGNWFTFTDNNFDLTAGTSRNVGYSISPLGYVTKTNQTNKNYTLTLTIEGNFPTQEVEFNVFVPYFEVGGVDENITYEDVERMLIFCQQNPEHRLCPKEKVVTVFTNASSDTFNYTMSRQQVNELWQFMFETADADDEERKRQKEFDDSLIGNLTNLTYNQELIKIEQEEMREQVEKNKNSTYAFILVIFFMFVIANLGMILYFKIRNRIKMKSLMFK